MTKREAGRRGGQATLERYGIDQLREWGRLGGRPRLLTYDDIMQLQRLENNRNGGNGLPGTLQQLKALYKLRQRSTGGTPQNTEAGVAQNPTRATPARKERSKPRC